MATSNPQTHVVIVSSPQVGHIVCNLEFGNRLVVDHNLHITYFVIAKSKASTGEFETIQSARAQNLLDIIQLPPVDIFSKVKPNSPIFTTFTTIMRETNPFLRSAIPKA
nr:udp-glycosyltransferase 72d1 [Quercus suber]